MERIFYADNSLENYKLAAESYIRALDNYRIFPGCMERDHLSEAENSIRELMGLPFVDYKDLV